MNYNLEQLEEQAIRTCIENNPKLPYEEICDLLGMNVRTFYRKIKKLNLPERNGRINKDEIKNFLLNNPKIPNSVTREKFKISATTITSLKKELNLTRKSPDEKRKQFLEKLINSFPELNSHELANFLNMKESKLLKEIKYFNLNLKN